MNFLVAGCYFGTMYYINKYIFIVIGAFALSSDGTLSVQGSLDYERIQTYSLVVQAQDGGTPQMSGIATLAVQVLDVNDNAPMFIGIPPKNDIPEVSENI